MTGRRDEVEHGVDAIVPEAGVSLDTGLLRQDIVILPLEEANNLREAVDTMLANCSIYGHVVVRT